MQNHSSSQSNLSVVPECCEDVSGSLPSSSQALIPDHHAEALSNLMPCAPATLPSAAQILFILEV